MRQRSPMAPSQATCTSNTVGHRTEEEKPQQASYSPIALFDGHEGAQRSDGRLREALEVALDLLHELGHLLTESR